MSSEAFIQRMIVLYGPPETMDDDAFLKEYTDILRPFDGEMLKAAGDHIRATHKRARWPNPAEVIEALDLAQQKRNEVNDRRIAAERAEHDGGSWSRHRMAVASKAMRSPLGIRAADEGWITQLWDFYRENLRYPSGYEIQRLIDGNAEFEHTVDSLENARVGTIAGVLFKLGNTMRMRGHQLAEIARGEREALTPITSGQVDLFEPRTKGAA